MCNDFTTGLAEKFINIRFGDVVGARVALDLHRPIPAVLVAKHQINAAISSPALRPFIPQPHLVNLRRPFWIGFEEPFDEVLELFALDQIGLVGMEAGVKIGELGGHFTGKYESVKGSSDNA